MTAHAADFAAALGAFNAGDYARAEQLGRRRLTHQPDDEATLLLVAMSLQELGAEEEALATYRRLTELAPAAAANWGNLGSALRDVNRNEEAEQAYLRAIELDPNEPQHRVNLGFLLGDVGDVSGARTAMLDAVDLDPSLAEARIYGSLACFECGDARNAERLLQGHEIWRHDLNLEQLLDLARALLQLGHEPQSSAALEQARAIAPSALLVQARRALMFERVNRLDEARAAVDALPDHEAIRDPELAREVINARAAVAVRDKDLARARALLERLGTGLERAPQMRAGVLFALAKVTDKLDDTAATMATLRRAHDDQLVSARTLVPEMFVEGAEPLKTATVLVSPEQFAAWPPPQPVTPSPVFIMGFPRSGTTLLEQMLDAHPDYQSMDERAFLQGVVERMEAMGLKHPQQLGELDAHQLDELRAAYWNLVATAVHLEPGRRLVDKNPLNMLRVPIIHRLFPDAPIILALRHPCDVLLSCYMQNFRSPSFMVLCSTLERLARSYVNAMKFWIHHEKLLAPRVFHLRYEDMLDDFEGHVQRIGDFLGLADPRSMLGFQEHARGKGFISTPSYSQVIEPLNKGSVGRWRKYEPYFADALPILRPIMEHWGYEA